ncbi:hypothetical protein G7Z17_g12611 [Cylindrodendrum hubeiense]|uniref:NACHT domain-containing protein n=1 Tax=Cylindrodendrum hubeiense TaxID=595255 RepID=A0A9P5GXD0_9HYPO|nr:hypothetical protein G7Z17_g12611 [Cylindrodendrum hubeiense]
MADPLSVSVSIAGLISLGDVVFRAVFKYARAVKDAKSDIQSLADEINGLATVLRSLQALALDLESEGDSFDPTLRIHCLSHCTKTFDKIEQRVRKASNSFGKSKSEGITRQLKWPFSASETKELLTELSRHKGTITVALSADSMRKLQQSLTRADEIANQVSRIEGIAKRIEINTQIAVDDEKQRVLDYFMKVNPQPNLEMSIKLQHAMTGLWLTEAPDFTHWLATPGSRLWLSGIPGAGKTVLAGAVVQEALMYSHHATAKVSVGFFFCDYKNHSNGDPANILGAVASQLALQEDGAFDILRNYYDDLHPKRGLARTPDSEELRAKIGSMAELFDHTIVIIDGLDECGDNTDDVVDVFSELVQFTTSISMAIFSRDHYNIRVRLEDEFKHIPIAAHTEDVRLYVGFELDERVRRSRLELTSIAMKDEIRETLVNRAQGM